MQLSLLKKAWFNLIVFFSGAFLVSFILGVILIEYCDILPETIFFASSKRLSFVVPFIESGMWLGLDQGLSLFVWNIMGALASISFLLLVDLFDPDKRTAFPQIIRYLFCGTGKMRLLCYLPGCQSIESENVRRAYVWLMIPLLAMILLGIEAGFMVSAGKAFFGAYHMSAISLLPHGIIEIPVFALAGAVTYGAHLQLKNAKAQSDITIIFVQLAEYRRSVPILKLVICVMVGLFIAGMIEAHVTPKVMSTLGRL